MKRFSITLAVGLILLTSYSTALAQRRGGGRSMGGGGRSFGGGGMSMSARPAARPMPSRSMGGGFSSAARMAPRSAPIASQMPARSGQHFSGVGPGGGSFQAGRGSGSFTTQGGATVDYGGRGGSRTGPAGVTRGRGVGGVKVTGPGGQEFSKVGRAGGVQGPGGNAIGGSRGISQTTGPAGSARSISRTGFASGPNSMSAFRGGVAVGPGGVVAGRTGVAANGHGTYFRSAAAVSGQGVAVRRAAVGYHGCFTNTWCAKYPAAWYPVPGAQRQHGRQQRGTHSLAMAVIRFLSPSVTTTAAPSFTKMIRSTSMGTWLAQVLSTQSRQPRSQKLA